MTNGASNTGDITVGDVDTWTFEANQGNPIALSMGTVGSGSGNFRPWIRLVSPTGALLGSNALVGTAQISVTAPVTGTYTVLVGSNNGLFNGTGSYLLTLGP